MHLYILYIVYACMHVRASFRSLTLVIIYVGQEEAWSYQISDQMTFSIRVKRN